MFSFGERASFLDFLNPHTPCGCPDLQTLSLIQQSHFEKQEGLNVGFFFKAKTKKVKINTQSHQTNSSSEKQMGIGLLNVALKQPLPPELSALFMCTILQRRQHMHFAGQARAYGHLQPSFSFSFAFYRGKTNLVSLLILNVRSTCISWFALVRI